jgi:KRAB domain-containing zinc finger protein
VCVLCNKSFRLFVTFVRHMKMHSDEDKEDGTLVYKCQQCGKLFSCKKYLTEHKNIHTGERPHECGVCNKRFTQSSGLRNHMKIHRNHHDDGKKTFVCEWQDCGKEFKSLLNLRRHFKTHTGERRYACVVCDRRFAFPFTLRRHIRTHGRHDEVPNRTEACENKAKNKSDSEVEEITDVTQQAWSACDHYHQGPESAW